MQSILMGSGVQNFVTNPGKVTAVNIDIDSNFRKWMDIRMHVGNVMRG